MRPTWAEINLTALKHNFMRATEIVGERVNVLAVVKADAYGHGAVQVTKALKEVGCEFYGVATVDEALELRESGLNDKIIILSGINEDEIEAIIQNRLTPVVYSIDLLNKLNNHGLKNNIKNKYHLKIDTGMNRLGLESAKVDEYISSIVNLNNVEMEGLFTHLSCADTDTEYTNEQLNLFNEACVKFQDSGFKPVFTHCANSAALQRYRQSHYNMVRPGIMLYGSCGADDIYLHPVMMLKTRIIQTKQIPKGSKVSYGADFITKRKTSIAVLPIGYADGYSRHLSNKAVVSINGQTATVIGRVCMDLIIVDITDVKDAKEGSEVVLFGDEVVNIDSLAASAGTISYELLSNVGKRVRRVYV